MAVLKYLSDKLIVPLALGTAISSCAATYEYQKIPIYENLHWSSIRNSDWSLKEKEEFGTKMAGIIEKKKCDVAEYHLLEIIKKEENNQPLLDLNGNSIIEYDLLVGCYEKDSEGRYWPELRINLDKLKREVAVCQGKPCSCPRPVPEQFSFLDKIMTPELSKVIQMYIYGPKNKLLNLK